MERFATGFHGLTMVMGGLPTGQGFALGPQCSRLDLAGGALKFRTSARAASARAVLIDLQVGMPKLAGGKVFVDFLAQHRHLPRLEYFGPVPETVRVSLEGTLSLGVTGGFLEVNTGPGNNDDLPRPLRCFRRG